MWHFISTVRIPFTKECFAQSLDEIYPVVLFNWLILIRRAFLSIWLADLIWIKTLNTTGEQSLWNIHIHLQCSSTVLIYPKWGQQNACTELQIQMPTEILHVNPTGTLYIYIFAIDFILLLMLYIWNLQNCIIHV